METLRGTMTRKNSPTAWNSKGRTSFDIPRKAAIGKKYYFPLERACVLAIHFAYVILSIGIAGKWEKSNSKNKKIGESDYGEN